MRLAIGRIELPRIALAGRKQLVFNVITSVAQCVVRHSGGSVQRFNQNLAFRGRNDSSVYKNLGGERALDRRIQKAWFQRHSR